jgi:hypothetical protein
MRINSYKKVEACIVGKLETLGLYDVKLDAIEEYKIRNEPIRFWSDDIYLVTELRHQRDVHEIGFLHRDFLFYELIPNFYNGENFRRINNDELVGVMFDPKVILHTVEKILSNKELLLESFSTFMKAEIKRNQEFEKFSELKALLIDAIEQNQIVGFKVG